MEELLPRPEAKPSGQPSPKNQGEELPDPEVVGQELKEMRQRVGLTRDDVRKLLGHFDKQMIYRWESGKRVPSLVTAVQLAIVYKCSFEELCPSLWNYFSKQIGERQTKLAEGADRSAFRRESAHRTRKWEAEIK